MTQALSIGEETLGHLAGSTTLRACKVGCGQFQCHGTLFVKDDLQKKFRYLRKFAQSPESLIDERDFTDFFAEVTIAEAQPDHKVPEQIWRQYCSLQD